MFPGRALVGIIGLSISDLVEMALAALLILTAVLWPGIERGTGRFAKRTVWCMLVLAVLPVGLRLALLAHHPVPTPDIYDEFSHLLEADTLRHFRLANPTHPMHRFFETFFVLQEPTYSSIYPIGQGLLFALFGLPWAGVLVSTSALCTLCYWMLKGWVTPGWALMGSLFAVIEFGPLNPWMNNYWGGASSAAAGCLVFGALPRIRRYGRFRDAAIMGLGLGIHVLTRPYETVFLGLAAVAFLVPDWRRMLKPLAIAGLVACPALAITLAQNHAVTGKWTKLPYALSQEQYGVPASLTFQATPHPARALTREQQLDYKMQSGFRGPGPETVAKFLLRLEYRVRYYRFYFLPPLYLALFTFLFTLRKRQDVWVAATLLLFALGINFFPEFQFHYLAAVVCLFVLVSVAGLQRMGSEASSAIVLLCFVHFAVLYGWHLVNGRAAEWETWTGINTINPARRIAVQRQIAKMPGKLLIFVRYFPQHIFQEEWVFNEADIDGARVVWARDLGTAEDEKLRQYYPSRAALLLEPDLPDPRLSPYLQEPVVAPVESPAVTMKKLGEQKKPMLMFEPVK